MDAELKFMNIDVLVDRYDTGDTLILGGPSVEVIKNVFARTSTVRPIGSVLERCH
jgi:hypothetical protein